MIDKVNEKTANLSIVLHFVRIISVTFIDVCN